MLIRGLMVSSPPKLQSLHENPSFCWVSFLCREETSAVHQSSAIQSQWTKIPGGTIHYRGVTAAADEEELEEPPHPASTPTASSGRAVRTAIRRMGNKPCRRRQCRHRRKPRQPSGLSGPDGPGPVPGPSRPATTAAPTLPPLAGYLRPAPLPVCGEFTCRR